MISEYFDKLNCEDKAKCINYVSDNLNITNYEVVINLKVYDWESIYKNITNCAK